MFPFFSRVRYWFPAALLCVCLQTPSAGRLRAEVLLVPEDFTLEEALAAAGPGDEVSVAANTLDGATVVLPDGIIFSSRELQANRIKQLDLEGLAQGVEIVGFLVGHESDSFEGGREGVRVVGSTATFRQCAFQHLVPYGGDFLPPGILPGDSIPIRASRDSIIEFHECTFRRNYTGGGGGHTHSLRVHGVGSFGDDDPTGRLGFFGCDFETQSSPIYAKVPVEVIDCTFESSNQYLISAYRGLRMEGCLVANFSTTDIIDCAFQDCFGYTEAIHAAGDVQIHGNTIVGTRYWYSEGCFCPIPAPGEMASLIRLDQDATGSVTQNLLIDQPGSALEAPSSIEVACNDAFGSGADPWAGGIGDPTALVSLGRGP